MNTLIICTKDEVQVRDTKLTNLQNTFFCFFLNKNTLILRGFEQCNSLIWNLILKPLGVKNILYNFCLVYQYIHLHVC